MQLVRGMPWTPGPHTEYTCQDVVTEKEAGKGWNEGNAPLPPPV